MANTPASGIYYPDGATAANLATILSDMATSIDVRVVSTFASTSARDTAFSGLTASQRAGAKVYVTGVGWMGYNASSGSYNSANWVAEERVKGGRFDGTAEGSNMFRISSSLCFFNGQSPTSVVCMSALNGYVCEFGAFDGSGALIKIFNNTTGAQLTSGNSGAFYWIAFR